MWVLKFVVNAAYNSQNIEKIHVAHIFDTKNSKETFSSIAGHIILQRPGYLMLN